ncbi:MAG: zinc ribbon domain-containing protein [Deltaproteobacteria bacterium]|nr:zinc ribbon domain-containing protein [Deltaproteobacteria bacterium]NIS77919.1 zinc ribbon domain-containing protein [Deltaproteobacteria bacterium]
MPIYEYSCKSCNKIFEAYRKISEDKEHERCPYCDGEGVKRGFSLFARTRPGTGKSSCGPKRSPFR